MGKGEDKHQRSRRKATAAELARKAAHRYRANDDNAAKKRVANSAAIKDAHRNPFKGSIIDNDAMVISNNNGAGTNIISDNCDNTKNAMVISANNEDGDSSLIVDDQSSDESADNDYINSMTLGASNSSSSSSSSTNTCLNFFFLSRG